MVMDQSMWRIYGSLDQIKLHDDDDSAVSLDQSLVNRLKLEGNSVSHSFVDSPGRTKHGSLNQEGDSSEDYDFSDVDLKYITEMLMEEDMEEKNCMFQESSAALQAAEKSLYDLIGEKYPPSPEQDSLTHVEQKLDCPDESSELSPSYNTSTISSSSSNSTDRVRNRDLGEDMSSSFASQTSHRSVDSAIKIQDVSAGSPVSTLRIWDIYGDSESMIQFKQGFEEASKFLPNGGNLFVDMQNNGLLHKELKEEARDEYAMDGSRGKKNPHPQDFDEEGGKSAKQSAVSSESDVSSEMFDMVLLQCGSESALRETLLNGQSKNVQRSGQSKGSNGGKSRSKQRGKRGIVDLRTLLMLCAQAVAADNRRSANDLLKQIRQHSYPRGDGMQRIAHYFVDALEARLAGSGTDSYTAVITKPVSAASVLKAYHLYLAACPFIKISNFFSNKIIMNLAEKASKVHIIDFGILYGFQWPFFIQSLSSRRRPPKLRITGIDLPIPGFRPAERVEETGRRLANYAEKFKVPFEFNAIAQKWDSIQIEDLKIESDELLVVNCLYRSRYLLDETVLVESPRNKVLNLIRKVNPDLFIQGVVNGHYSAPFFLTRFREALFHYSTLFDMLENTIPREIEERVLIEREIFGREVMNVVACEGVERNERPETYKQWQVRNTRAGFRQVPLNEELKKRATERVTNHYHKDFMIDEDGHWLLQGWKGRIIYALASWAPVS